MIAGELQPSITPDSTKLSPLLTAVVHARRHTKHVCCTEGEDGCWRREGLRSKLSWTGLAPAAETEAGAKKQGCAVVLPFRLVAFASEALRRFASYLFSTGSDDAVAVSVSACSGYCSGGSSSQFPPCADHVERVWFWVRVVETEGSKWLPCVLSSLKTRQIVFSGDEDA